MSNKTPPRPKNIRLWDWPCEMDVTKAVFYLLLIGSSHINTPEDGWFGRPKPPSGLATENTSRYSSTDTEELLGWPQELKP